MLNNNKGIYPNWVGDIDLINQVLNEIIREGGRLPYTYVVNPAHNPDVQLRMKAILDKMQKERLILLSPTGDNHLEIDIEGSRAALLGYRKFRRIKRWDNIMNTLGSVSLILFFIAIVALTGFIVYFLLHRFKVV